MLAILLIGLTCFGGKVFGSDGQKEGQAPHIVFLVSEDPANYEAHKTIPSFAELLRQKHGFRCTVIQGEGEPSAFRFPGLERLQEADLLVVFFRRRALTAEQLGLIRAHLKEGKPLVGIRTANHAFSMNEAVAEGHKEWREFVPEVLGCKNRGYGPAVAGTEVAVLPQAADHPILKGIPTQEWHSGGSLYLVKPLVDTDATVLLTGSADSKTEPIAWTRNCGMSRIFYTSLGYPRDFQLPQYRQLLINGINWALEKPSEERPISLNELRNTRKKLAFKKRFVANNDGCDCLYHPNDEDVTKEIFLEKRTTALADSQVDTLSYCTVSSGFGYFTHNTKKGQLLLASASESGIAPDQRNITSDLIEMGTDPLQWVLDFGHENNKEVFWSMRMNDTHDVVHRTDKPFFLLPKLKEDHPEWLIGKIGKQPPFGDWSSVDYGRPEIRDLAFSYIEEVCQNYDVDGIELDFFRHMCYFKSVAQGKKASRVELNAFTQLMQRIRDMTEAIGIKRGRPILISIRVPDSAQYAKGVGLDIERWMKKGLIDILITTSYFRLNPWEYSVKLGNKYGVAVYPCLTDSRLTGTNRFNRNSLPTLRGRAMNAWHSGAQGLYIFNYFDPNSAMWSELGNPETMRYKQKLYFATLVDGDPTRYLVNGDSYRKLPKITPSYPLAVSATSATKFDLPIAEDIQAAIANHRAPKTLLHLEVPKVTDASQLLVRINGQVLKTASRKDRWIDYEVPAAFLKQGNNQISVARAKTSVKSDNEWGIVYSGENLPQAPWKPDRPRKNVIQKMENGALLIADRGKQAEDYLYYRYAWGADVHSKAIVEARIKVISGQNAIIFGTGVSGERLLLESDKIYLHHNQGISYSLDTTSEFHDYRLEILKTQIRVYIDDVLRMKAPRGLAPRPGYANSLAFGASNSTILGEALWESVKVRTENVSVHDAVVSISYPTE